MLVLLKVNHIINFMLKCIQSGLYSLCKRGLNLEWCMEFKLANHKEHFTYNFLHRLPLFPAPIPEYGQRCRPTTSHPHVTVIKFHPVWVSWEKHQPMTSSQRIIRTCFKHKITSSHTWVIWDDASVWRRRFSIKTPCPSGWLVWIPDFPSARVIMVGRTTWPGTPSSPTQPKQPLPGLETGPRGCLQASARKYREALEEQTFDIIAN